MPHRNSAVTAEVSGNTFEGNVSWQLFDSSQKIVEKGFVTTSQGMWTQAPVDLGALDPGTYELQHIIRAPEGTSLESTEVITNRVANAVRQRLPEVSYTLVTIAGDPAKTRNLGNVYVRLKPIDVAIETVDPRRGHLNRGVRRSEQRSHACPASRQPA